ncbi:MAG: flagellar filament capping protein FliD [Solirubrobacteraceae bacterium]|nr:flagellar filament capping protein FliD [Solirubrobacteraceae bacterium]
MAGISFSGLASGLDTEAIISALMAIERQPRTRLTLNQSAASARQQALSDVLSRMKTLRTAAQDLGSSLLWTETQKATSSDPNKVAVSLTSGAAPGGYAISVTQMATAAQATYAFTPPAGASTLDINGQAIELEDGDTLDTLVSRINGTPETGVYAVNVDGKLVLTSRTTGSATTISATGAELALESTKPGRDLKYSINGEPQPDSQSNTLANVIPGVTLTIKALTTDTTIEISPPGVDADAVKKKLKAFVDAYNDVVDFVEGKLTEKKVVKEGDQALTSAEAAQGALFGDTGLRNMLSQMRMLVSAAVPGLPGDLNSLAALGISTGKSTGAATTADAKKGKLVFDESVFNEAYAKDPLAVRKLLGGVSGTTGLSQTWSQMLDVHTAANGVLDQRVAMANSELDRIKDAIARIDDRLVRREETLRRQFTAMELALSRSNSQYADLLSSLSRSSSSKN